VTFLEPNLDPRVVTANAAKHVGLTAERNVLRVRKAIVKIDIIDITYDISSTQMMFLYHASKNL
jgi:hypothetical protein